MTDLCMVIHSECKVHPANRWWATNTSLTTLHGLKGWLIRPHDCFSSHQYSNVLQIEVVASSYIVRSGFCAAQQFGRFGSFCERCWIHLMESSASRSGCSSATIIFGFLPNSLRITKSVHVWTFLDVQYMVLWQEQNLRAVREQQHVMPLWMTCPFQVSLMMTTYVTFLRHNCEVESYIWQELLLLYMARNKPVVHTKCLLVIKGEGPATFCRYCTI